MDLNSVTLVTTLPANHARNVALPSASPRHQKVSPPPTRHHPANPALEPADSSIPGASSLPCCVSHPSGFGPSLCSRPATHTAKQVAVLDRFQTQPRE